MRSRRIPLWRWLVAALSATIGLVIAWAWWPLPGAEFESHPSPASSYEEALRRITAVQDAERDSVLPDCVTRLLSHDSTTARVVVFVHGYTSCPAQFVPLGEQFFAAGFNVLIARMPHHGFPNRMTTRHSELTAAELVNYADAVVDMAQGLGDEVTVAGLSAGGLVSAWVAQNRADVATAGIFSPVIGYTVLPPALALPASRIFRILPDEFTFWDPALGEQLGPAHSYPRYSRRALAQLLRLSVAVQRQARKGPPAVHRIVVVTNALDELVSRPATGKLADSWAARPGVTVSRYELERSVGVGHDFIEPQNTDQKTAVVYPILFRLLTTAQR